MHRGAPVTQITKPQHVGAIRVQPAHETVMAKKKKRREKARVPQTPPLEELLRTGEAVPYGQVCWSIANRGTDRARPGEVITLDGDDEAGSHAKGKFRLTRKSIKNIERCLGMRTCGEAVALFAQADGGSFCCGAHHHNDIKCRQPKEPQQSPYKPK